MSPKLGNAYVSFMGAGVFGVVLIGFTAGTIASDWRPVTAPITIGGRYYEPSAAPSNPGAIEISSSPVGILRFNARYGEYSRWDAAEGSAVDRAELTGWAYREALGTDIWLSFSQRVLPGDPITSRWCVIGQMHATTQPGDHASSPPFALQLLPGDVFKISTRYAAAARHTKNPEETVRYAGPFERGRWYRHVFRLRFGYQGDAILQWWRDGVPMLDISGFSMGYNDPEGPYWQFGVYRNSSRENLTVEFQNVEIGTVPMSPGRASYLQKLEPHLEKD